MFNRKTYKASPSAMFKRCNVHYMKMFTWETLAGRSPLPLLSKCSANIAKEDHHSKTSQPSTQQEHKGNDLPFDKKCSNVQWDARNRVEINCLLSIDHKMFIRWLQNIFPSLGISVFLQDIQTSTPTLISSGSAKRKYCFLKSTTCSPFRRCLNIRK